MYKNRLFFLALSLLTAVVLVLASCQREPIEDPTDDPTEEPTPGGGGGNSDTTATFLPTGTVIPNAVTDYDGNFYDAVVIGNQVWMAENLITTHFADGEEILSGEGSPQVASATVPYRYVPGAGTADVAVYGYLYNWCAVMHGAFSSDESPSGVQGICPNGWHVPSDAEWDEFADTISSHPEYVAGDDIRQIDKAIASNTHWHSSTYPNSVGNNQNQNNATHFGLMPAGLAPGSSPGGCSLEFYANLWSCTEYKNDPDQAWFRFINNQSARAFHAHSNAHYPKTNGMSVRCLRDTGANDQ